MLLVLLCVILVRNGMLYKQRNNSSNLVTIFNYVIGLCIDTHEKTLIKIWPVLVMLYVHVLHFFLHVISSHEIVLLYNGVTSMWHVLSFVAATAYGHKYKMEAKMDVRATSHMSQWPWPWNGEGPWLLSNSGTMGIGLSILCGDSSSNIVWNKNGLCWGNVAYFISGKRRATLPH